MTEFLQPPAVPENAPDLGELKAWLGLEAEDTVDDVVLQESLDAALQAQASAVAYPWAIYEGETEPAPVFSQDLREAIFLRAQRLAARRNSPEAVVGLTGSSGDFVGARLPSGDPDVMRLEGPWLLIATA